MFGSRLWGWRGRAILGCSLVRGPCSRRWTPSWLPSQRRWASTRFAKTSPSSPRLPRGPNTLFELHANSFLTWTGCKHQRLVLLSTRKGVPTVMTHAVVQAAARQNAAGPSQLVQGLSQYGRRTPELPTMGAGALLHQSVLFVSPESLSPRSIFLIYVLDLCQDSKNCETLFSHLQSPAMLVARPSVSDAALRELNLS